MMCRVTCCPQAVRIPAPCSGDCQSEDGSSCPKAWEGQHRARLCCRSCLQQGVEGDKHHQSKLQPPVHTAVQVTALCTHLKQIDMSAQYALQYNSQGRSDSTEPGRVADIVCSRVFMVTGPPAQAPAFCSQCSPGHCSVHPPSYQQASGDISSIKTIPLSTKAPLGNCKSEHKALQPTRCICMDINRLQVHTSKQQMADRAIACNRHASTN